MSVPNVQQHGAVIHTLGWPESLFGGFPGDSVIKNTPAMQEMRIQSLGQEDPLQEEMETGFRAGIIVGRAR